MAEIKGKGSSLFMLVGSTYMEIAQVEKFTPPSKEVGDITAQYLSGSSTVHKGGMPDCGPLSFDIVWDPDNTSHQALLDVLDGSEHAFRFDLTDDTPTVGEFVGYVKSFKPGELAPNTFARATVDIQPNGDVEYA